jgi:hypothetical protein
MKACTDRVIFCLRYIRFLNSMEANRCSLAFTRELASRGRFGNAE